MKKSNIEIVNMINILGEFDKKRLPQKISYAITRNIMTLQKEYACYEVELKKLLDKYDSNIEHDENGEVVINNNGVPIINDEQERERFTKELAELLNVVVDIDIYTVDIDVFNYDDNTSRYDPMSAYDIIKLQSIICA